MTVQEQLAAIETTLAEVATDWSGDALSFVLSQYVDAEVLTDFAAERVKAFVGSSLTYGCEPPVTMLMAWLDGFIFGVRFDPN